MALICSIRPRRSCARARPRTSLTGASIHGRLARKKSLCAIAIVSASLFHYDGVWRVPYPIRLAFPVLTALLLLFLLFRILTLLFLSLLRCSFPLPQSSSPAFSSPSVFSFSFIRRTILVHVPPASFVQSTDGETPRTHLRDDDVRDITRRDTWSQHQREKERKSGEKVR